VYIPFNVLTTAFLEKLLNNASLAGSSSFLLQICKIKSGLCEETQVILNVRFIFLSPLALSSEPGSSGSIMSDYGLNDRAFEVRSPAEAKDLVSVSRPALGPSLPSVQWVPGVLSPGLKRGRGVTLTTHPPLMPRSRMSRSYTSSPPKRLHGV
jgi:hypothetical protein